MMKKGLAYRKLLSGHAVSLILRDHCGGFISTPHVDPSTELWEMTEHALSSLWSISS